MELVVFFIALHGFFTIVRFTLHPRVTLTDTTLLENDEPGVMLPGQVFTVEV
jgi:hypothetical protein